MVDRPVGKLKKGCYAGNTLVEATYVDEKSPPIIASYLFNLWNGINVTLRMDPDKEMWKSVIEMNL